LTSFKSNIEGLQRLVDLALSSSSGPIRIIFISSIGVLGSALLSRSSAVKSLTTSPDARTTTGSVPEQLVSPDVALGSGYSESKWVAESILAEAAPQGLDARIVRVGQLAGAANGLWNMKEWFPALVQASQVVGCLPDVDGVSQRAQL
jgi:thioester reductase-like protein